MATAGWSRREAIGAMAAGALCALAPAVGRAEPFSGLLIRDVLLIDGTGGPGRLADVLVRGDTIEAIGRVSRRAARGARIVEGGGRVLAPGFIDLHTHGDPLEDSYAGFLAMGVTTVLLGQDGGSPALEGEATAAGSLPAWMAAVENATPDVNVATLSGHGALRRRAEISDATRRPSDAELARMQALLENDLRAGAFGMSTGLEYVPGRYAELRELAALGGIVARHDGVAMSHLRSEDDDAVADAIREHIETSRPARTHVSHLKVVYGRGGERAQALLDELHAQRRAGVELTADAYPYSASYTGVAILFPEWALPPVDYAQVLQTRRDELRDHLERRMTRRGGPDALLFGSGEHAGRTLSQVAAEAGEPFADVLLGIGPRGGSAAHFVMDEALQDRLLIDPMVAVATDGAPGGRHPRATGTFAKWIEVFAVRDGRVSLEEAVRKASGLPASILRLPDRGVVRVGAKADLALFDPSRVRARSDYVDPFAHAEGFDLVVVNGRPAFEDGERVGSPGQLLRHRSGRERHGVA